MPTCGPRACARSMFCSLCRPGLMGAIADGVGEVRRAVREQVRNGANHIKIMAGGGCRQPQRPHRRHAVLDGGTARRVRGSRGREPLRAGPRLLAARRDARGAGRRALDRARQPDRRGHGADHEDAWRLPRADAGHLRRAGRRRREARLVGRHARQAAHRAGARHRGGAHRARRRRAGGLRHRPAGPHARPPERRVHAARRRHAAGGGAAERHHHRRAADAAGGAHRRQLVPGAWADLLVVDGDPTQSLQMLAERGRCAPPRQHQPRMLARRHGHHRHRPLCPVRRQRASSATTPSSTSVGGS
jgi:hypothetical protein